MPRVSETFTDTFTVAAPPEVVYAHLAEPLSTVGLSPLIVAVRDTRRTSGNTVTFTAVERFPIAGPLRYDNLIKVTSIEEDPPRRLVWAVESPGRVSVRFVTELAPAPAGSDVTITVTLQMPRILRGYVVRTAKRVQAQRARILTDRMSRPAT